MDYSNKRGEKNNESRKISPSSNVRLTTRTSGSKCMYLILTSLSYIFVAFYRIWGNGKQSSRKPTKGTKSKESQLLFPIPIKPKPHPIEPKLPSTSSNMSSPIMQTTNSSASLKDSEETKKVESEKTDVVNQDADSYHSNGTDSL